MDLPQTVDANKAIKDFMATTSGVNGVIDGAAGPVMGILGGDTIEVLFEGHYVTPESDEPTSRMFHRDEANVMIAVPETADVISVAEFIEKYADRVPAKTES